MNEEKEENEKRNHSFFQIVSLILIVVLLVASFVELCVIISLKNKTDDMQHKLDNLPKEETESAPEIFEPPFMNYVSYDASKIDSVQL